MSRPLLAILLLTSGFSFAQKSIFPDEATKKAAQQLEPAELSAETRTFLRSKMRHHDKDYRELAAAVATLRMADIERLAQGIAVAPRLDRAMGASAKLPERFFELQDTLKREAQALAAAGKAHDDTEATARFATMLAQCQSCHREFKAQIEGK